MRRLASTLLLAVALLPCQAAASSGELTLPAPAGPTPLEAASMRIVLAPEPDGSFRAETSLTLHNPTSEAVSAVIALGPAGSGPTVASLAGGALEVATTADGPRTSFVLEASEAAVLALSQRIVPRLSPALAAPEAGWWGARRGPLLQPSWGLAVVHPQGSAFAAALVDVSVDLPGRPLASAVFATPPGRYDRGRLSWKPGRLTQPLRVAWPVVESEAFLPRTRDEAEAVLASWSPGLADHEIRLLRFGLLAAHGSEVADVDVARELSRERRPGWGRIAGPLAGSEREATEVLARAEPSATEIPRGSSGGTDHVDAPTATLAAREPARDTPAEVTEPERRAAVADSRPPAAMPADAPTPEAPEREAEKAAEPEVVPEPPAVPPEPSRPPPPPVPWLRSAPEARLFVARERSRGEVDPARLQAAIELIEARHGKPFDEDPEARALFEGLPWYEPEERWTSQRLPSPAREAIAILQGALGAP